MLYVGVEYGSGTTPGREEVGQMMKLDPSKPDDPIVWAAFDEERNVGGILGTPALYKDIVIFDTDGGDVLGLDRTTGAERWRFHLPARPGVAGGRGRRAVHRRLHRATSTPTTSPTPTPRRRSCGA